MDTVRNRRLELLLSEVELNRLELAAERHRITVPDVIRLRIGFTPRGVDARARKAELRAALDQELKEK